MPTAVAILVVVGVLLLIAGALTGIAMGSIRQTEPTVPKYLSLAHAGAYQQGAMLLGLGFAVSYSDLSAWINTAGAFLVGLAALLLFAKDVVNWRQSIVDEFAERSLGYKLGVVMGPLHIVGVVVIAVGVISAVA